MPSAELHDILEKMEKYRDRTYPDDPELRLAEVRKMIGAQMFRPPDGAAVSQVNAGGVPGEWVVAGGASSDRRLLYFHGGGYCAGSLDSHRDLGVRLSQTSGCSVLMADYRLAPENPFPAALDDAVACYRWVREQGPDGPSPSASLFVGGDSAGGGLTLALLMKLREMDEPMPNAAACLCSWTDLSSKGRSETSKGFPIDMAAMYLGGADPKNPFASPVYGDYGGLPPLLMQAGGADELLDHTIRAAEKAKAAGVDVNLEVYPDMFHIWHLYAAKLPEARDAIDVIARYLTARG